MLCGQYSTFTRVHTHLNLRVITRTQARIHESGGLPYPLQVFFFAGTHRTLLQLSSLM